MKRMLPIRSVECAVCAGTSRRVPSLDFAPIAIFNRREFELLTILEGPSQRRRGLSKHRLRP